jgi:hypothetical protein
MVYLKIPYEPQPLFAISLGPKDSHPNTGPFLGWSTHRAVAACGRLLSPWSPLTVHLLTL